MRKAVYGSLFLCSKYTFKPFSIYPLENKKYKLIGGGTFREKMCTMCCGLLKIKYYVCTEMEW